MSHQTWSIEEGLPETSVHQVFQSQDGYLWLATEGGAFRFDGVSFKVLRHETQPAFTSNDVSAIAQDPSGSLWFGTADGLVQNRGSAFHRFSEGNGLPSATVLALATADGGALFALTPGGVARFDGAVFHPIDTGSATITALETAPDGSLLLMTRGGMLRYGRGATTSQVLPPNASASALGLQAGLNGAVWAYAANAVYMSATGFQRTLRSGVDLPGNRITALYIDRNGAGWIGTDRGLAWLDATPQARPKSVEALRAESILSIFEDREGNIWIGTEASGLHALRPRKFHSEGAASGQGVTAVVTSRDGTPWFGTRDGGVHSIHPGPAETPVQAAALTSPIALSLARGAKNDVWVGTPDGLNHIEGRSVHQYTSADGLPDDFVRSVLVDSRATVWAGTRRGLARLDHGGMRTLTHADGLASDSVGPLLEFQIKDESGNHAASDPDLWIGTSAGLSHLHGTQIETFTPESKPSDAAITALAADSKAALWTAVHASGLTRFYDGRFHPIASVALPKEITSLVADRKGYLWMRAPNAVYRASEAELRECAEAATRCNVHVSTFGVADGMPSDAAIGEGSPSLWQAADGAIWIATRKGIAVADPEHLAFNNVPPPVVIERFAVDDIEVPLREDEIQIPAGHRRYTFEYAALSYTLPSRNRYRYKLENFDRDWIDAGTTRSAYYTSLPPGHYQFRVLAENNDGVWNETGATVRFRILPSFYRRWWFYLLMLLAAAGIVFAVFRIRLLAVQRRFNLVLGERNRVAREIHDTLAQDFVSVSLQLDLTSGFLKAKQVEQAASQVQITRKLVKEGLEDARQGIWNLRANTASDSLPARLTAIVHRYGKSEHPPRLKIGGQFRKLSPNLENEILRIAQESLSNVARHAQAKNVFVELQYGRDKLLLTVRDDGSGFSPEEAEQRQGHYGLRGMKERALALGATLTMDSTHGEGSTVTLVVPLPATESEQA